MTDHEDGARLLAEAKALAVHHAWRLGKDEAADLAAEALLRGLEHPPHDGRMRPWLSRILRNLVVDRYRATALAVTHGRIPGGDQPADPEELAVNRERRTAVRRAVRQLPPAARKAVLQRYYLETAGQDATLRTRVRRGLASMRKMLGGLHGWAAPWRLLPAAMNPAVVMVALLAPPSAPPVPEPPPAATVARMAPTPPAAIAPTAPAGASAVVVSRPVRRATSEPAAPPPRRFDFDDDEVIGDFVGPDWHVLPGARPPPRPPSLIEIPDSFVGPLVKSLEDL